MANELILIIEDNPKNLKLVRDTLQVKGPARDPLFSEPVSSRA